MDDYLRMEGFASRLVPVKKIPNPNIVYFIDKNSMQKNLLNEPQGFSTTYQPGFKFRGLNDSTIFFDANEQNMVQNYRWSFLMLATYELYQDNDKTKCIQTLDQMGKVIPLSIIHMEWREEYSTLLLYYSAGDSVRFRSEALNCEEIMKQRISEPPTDQAELNLLYQYLINVYDLNHQYSEAANFLRDLLPSFPGDQNLLREIDRYNNLANQQKK